MAEDQPSESGFVFLEHDYSLPVLVLPDASGDRCPGPRMAQDWSLCLPSFAPSSAAKGTDGQSETSVVGGPSLVHSDLALRPGQSVSRPSVGGSPEVCRLKPKVRFGTPVWTYGSCGCGP